MSKQSALRCSCRVLLVHARWLLSGGGRGGCDGGRACSQVLSEGRLVEHGPPRDLSAKEGGMFASMVAAARATNNEQGSVGGGGGEAGSSEGPAGR